MATAMVMAAAILVGRACARGAMSVHCGHVPLDSSHADISVIRATFEMLSPNDRKCWQSLDYQHGRKQHYNRRQIKGAYSHTST